MTVPLAACSPAPVKKTEETPKPKIHSTMPYRMGGDFAGGGNMETQLANLCRGKILNALKNRSPAISLFDPTGFTTKVSRADFELIKNAKQDTSFLKHLDIGSQELTDYDIEPLSGLKLTGLAARDNIFKDLHALKNMTTLTSLDLSEADLNQDGIDVIAGLINLESLYISGIDFTGLDVLKLRNLKRLKRLAMESHYGVSAADMAALKAAFPFEIYERDKNFDVNNGNLDLDRIKAGFIEDGEYAEANLTIGTLIDKWSKYRVKPYPVIARGYRMRGYCLKKMARLKEAKSEYGHSLEIYEKDLPDDSVYPEVCLEYADVCERLKLPEDLRNARLKRVAADSFWARHKPSDKALKKYEANRKWLASHK